MPATSWAPSSPVTWRPSDSTSIRRLLTEAVEEQKATYEHRAPVHERPSAVIDLPVDAHLPDAYVPDEAQKLELYRRLARARTAGDIAAFRQEVIDRFGQMPSPVLRLVEVAELRLAAEQAGVASISREEGQLVVPLREPAPVRRDARACGRPAARRGADRCDHLHVEPGAHPPAARSAAVLGGDPGRRRTAGGSGRAGARPAAAGDAEMRPSVPDAEPAVTRDPMSDGLWSPGRRSLTIGLILTITVVAVEALAVSTIMPIVAGDLGDIELYGWVFSSFLLGSLIGIAVVGGLIDRLGLVVPFVGGLGIFSIGLADLRPRADDAGPRRRPLRAGVRSGCDPAHRVRGHRAQHARPVAAADVRAAGDGLGRAGHLRARDRGRGRDAVPVARRLHRAAADHRARPARSRCRR